MPRGETGALAGLLTRPIRQVMFDSRIRVYVDQEETPSIDCDLAQSSRMWLGAAESAAMRPGRVLLWLVPPAVLAVVAAILGATRGWQLVAVRPSHPAYVDLAQITYNADCPLPDAGQVGVPGCDPPGRPYNYPPIWAAIARLTGIGDEDTVWLGGVLAGVGLTALGVFFLRFSGRPTAGRIAILTAVTCSPAMLLMIARANIDLLMLALLVAAAVLIAASRDTAAAVVVAVAAGLKLFPIGGLLALRRRPAIAGALLSVVAIAVLAGPWLADIRAATPSSNRGSFGAGVLPSVARQLGWGDGVSALDQAAGVAMFVALFAALLLIPLGRRAVAAATAPLRGDELGVVAVLVGAGPFLVAYLLASNFDYRLAPLLFVVVACLRTDARTLHALTLGLVVVFWARGTQTPAALAGDLVLVVAAPYLAAVVTVLAWARWDVRTDRIAFLGRHAA